MAIVVNIEDLERGLRIWSERAKEGGWKERDDPENHLDGAKLLYAIILEGMMPIDSPVELN